MQVYGLYSLDPSCHTMSLALFKAHNYKLFLPVEWKQSLKGQLTINLYHTVFIIDRVIGLYGNDHVFLYLKSNAELPTIPWINDYPFACVWNTLTDSSATSSLFRLISTALMSNGLHSLRNWNIFVYPGNYFEFCTIAG